MKYWETVFEKTKILYVSITLMVFLVAFNFAYVALLASTVLVRPGPLLHFGLWLEMAGWLDSLAFLTAVQICDYADKKIKPWRLWWVSLMFSCTITLIVWKCVHL